MVKPIESASDTVGSGKARSLGLSVPEQVAPPPDCLFLQPNETSRWIAALPLANIGETSRQVYTKLGELNQFDIPRAARVKETESFRSMVAYIADSLRRHYMDASFPLSAKAWKTLILSRELHNELATSYKLIILDLLSASETRLDKKLLIIALHRALHYLGEVYLQTCLSYTAPAPGLWKEINTLFAFARQNQLQRVPVKMTLSDSHQTSTIEERFKALMLFATASPSRLPQLHLESLYQRAREWARLTRFIDPQQGISDLDALNVSLHLDEPPIHNALHQPPNGGPVVILDLRELVRDLQGLFQNAPLDGSAQLGSESGSLPKGLLQQLIRNWHSPSERRFQRTKLNFSLQVFCGVRAIHAGLLARHPANEAKQHAKRPDPYATSWGPGSAEGALTLMDDDGFSASLATPNSGTTGPVLDYDASFSSDGVLGGSGDPIDMPGDPSDNTVTTVNESASGYCIRWPAGERMPKTRVGDLIGVGADQEEAPFSLGVVRWLRCIDQSEVEIGLQIISNQVEAARAYAAIAEGRVPLRNRRDPVTCLHIPPLSRSGSVQKPYLILSSAGYELGTFLWLEQVASGKVTLIRLARLIDFGGVFARFEIEYMNTQDPNQQGDGSSRSQFEALWKSL